MPDEFGVCHCGGTGEDGCVPTLSPEEIRRRRRQTVYAEISAETSTEELIAGDGENGLGAALAQGTAALALSTPGINLLLGTPAPSLTQATGYPLLEQAASREPLLAEALRLDQPIPPAQPEH